MIRKSISLLLLALLATTLFVLPAAASYESEEIPAITPRYTYLQTVATNLSISGKSASLSGTIRAYSDVSKLEYAVYLQVKSGSSWSDVSSWNGSKNGTLASYNFSGTVSAGKTYRNKTVVTAYSGGQSETVTAYSGERVA